MSSNSLVYLISGANRGIGLALVKAALSQPNSIVFAGARNPTGSSELQQVASQHANRVFPVKLVSADEESNRKVVEIIKEKAGKLDVVIANAGIGEYVKFDDSNVADVVAEHHKVNTLGPLILFNSTKNLLLQASSPKFVVISTVLGSIEKGPAIPFDFLAYGSSKAAVNWIVKRIHVEYGPKGLVAFPIHPGVVETDMARSAWTPETIKALKGITPDESARLVLDVVDKATVEKDGGVFRNNDGSLLPW